MNEEIETIEPDDVEETTEVEVREETSTGVAPTRDQAVQHGSPVLVQFAADLRLAYQAGVSLTTTNFVPASFNGRPDQAAAAIITGLELGLTPMAALRSMDIINGTPALRANTLRAIALARGHQVWVEEATSQRAIVKGIRRGTDHVQESEWTMDRARAMKLAGKDNWQKQPQAMLVARATSELVRLIAPDDILGLAYVAEELEDGQIGEQPVVRSTRKVSRKKPAEVEKPKPTEEPQAEPVEVKAEAEATEDEAPADTPAEPGAEPADEPKVTSWDAVMPGEGFADLPEGFR